MTLWPRPSRSRRRVIHMVDPAAEGRIRPSLCGSGAFMCIAGYLPYADGYTHSKTGKPLANGVKNRQHANCPDCLAVAS